MQELSETDEATAVVRQINDETSHACCFELVDRGLSVGLEAVEVIGLERAHEHLSQQDDERIPKHFLARSTHHTSLVLRQDERLDDALATGHWW